MFFQKRKRPLPTARSGGRSPVKAVPESFYIGPDDLLKGNIVPRGRKKVRQFAVLVDTRVCVVTTGDIVNRVVYDALISAGAVKPAPEIPQEDPAPPPDEAEE